MKICLIADGKAIHTIRWANHFVKQGDEAKNTVIERGEWQKIMDNVRKD